MDFERTVLLLCGGLFVGMIVALEVGRRIGLRHRAEDPAGAFEGTGAIDGAVFALLGLLIAFTFSGAASRFDDRRRLIIEETNNIGTAYLRVDLVRPDAQPALRASFRHYLDSRIEVYRKLPDIAAAREELARSAAVQQEIWREAVDACRDQPTSAAMLLLPALNAMIDITSTRTLATRIHPPTTIFVMLSALEIVSALLAGYGMAARKKRSWIHVLGLAITLAFTVWVILDIEYPRMGLIRLTAFDQALVDLRRSM